MVIRPRRRERELKGETVTIILREQTGTNAGADPVWETHEEQVDDVLIQDGTQADSTASNRPDGISVAKTMHMPRAWPYRSLRGAKARIDGVEYAVLGDPRPYDGGLTPTRWNLTVQLHDERG